MSEPFVTVERSADGVALIRMDRPKANALSEELLRQLAEIVKAMAADPPGAVVVWGGPRIFAAGADVSEFGDAKRGGEVGSQFRRTLDALAALPRITIAAVAGYALGGGCELAMACDFRVAADNARFGQPEILLGIIPGGGGTQRLPRLVGVGRAKEITITGRQLDASEALRIGLVDRVVSPDGLLDAALGWAAEIAAGPVLAQAAIKRAVDQGFGGSLPAGLDLEGQLFAEVFSTEDAGIGTKSFLEHGPGKANFVGR